MIITNLIIINIKSKKGHVIYLVENVGLISAFLGVDLPSPNHALLTWRFFIPRWREKKPFFGMSSKNVTEMKDHGVLNWDRKIPLKDEYYIVSERICCSFSFMYITISRCFWQVL